MKNSRMIQYRYDIVTSLPETGTPELERKLQFHKQFMIRAQSNRVKGLGSIRKFKT